MTEPQQDADRPDATTGSANDRSHEFREIGLQLETARTAQGLSVEAVARKVLLSPNQIQALESGRLPSFYAPSFYAQSVQKYAHFLGISLDTTLASRQADKPGTSRSDARPPTDDASQSGRLATLVTSGSGMVRLSASGYSGPNRLRTLLIIAIFIVVTGIALVWFRQHSEENADSDTSGAPSAQSDQTEAASTRASENTTGQQATPTAAPHATSSTTTGLPAPAGPAVAALPATVSTTSASSSSSTSSSTSATTITADRTAQAGQAKGADRQIVLTFTSPCWVQVTRANGSTTEKIYSPQDSLNIDTDQITSLVIGNARSAHLAIGSNAIDMAQFMKGTSDVARISGSVLQSLATAPR